MKNNKGKRLVHIPINKNKKDEDKNPPGDKPETDVKEAEKQLPQKPEEKHPEKEKPELEYAELLDTLQRLKAEYANYQKRTEREREEYRTRCLREIYVKLLPVLDNLERAISAAREHDAGEELLSGVELIQKQFYQLLETEEIRPFDSLGKKFDPNFHDAVLMQETAEVEPDTVISEMEKGYLIGDRVLRAARVVVSRKPAEKNLEQEDEK